MISIVTAYYNRKALFRRTLQSIKNQNCEELLEVIAVDDGSKEDERLENLIEEFPFLKVIRLDPAKKWYHNSCIPFNIGFKAAKGDKIIIQNPECLHYGNILEYTENNLKEGNYLSFACFSLDKDSTENIEQYIGIPERIEEIIDRDNHTVEQDGDAGWYNHSIHRPVGYHFCTAISKIDLVDLGGFDELYALGIAYDDDEILHRIKSKKMKVEFIDSPIVLHQNHYTPFTNSYNLRENKELLCEINKKTFVNITKNTTYRKNKIIRFIDIDNKAFFLNLLNYAYKTRLFLKKKTQIFNNKSK